VNSDSENYDTIDPNENKTNDEKEKSEIPDILNEKENSDTPLSEDNKVNIGEDNIEENNNNQVNGENKENVNINYEKNENVDNNDENKDNVDSNDQKNENIDIKDENNEIVESNDDNKKNENIIESDGDENIDAAVDNENDNIDNNNIDNNNYDNDVNPDISSDEELDYGNYYEHVTKYLPKVPSTFPMGPIIVGVCGITLSFCIFYKKILAFRRFGKYQWLPPFINNQQHQKIPSNHTDPKSIPVYEHLSQSQPYCEPEPKETITEPTNQILKEPESFSPASTQARNRLRDLVDLAEHKVALRHKVGDSKSKVDVRAPLSTQERYKRNKSKAKNLEMGDVDREVDGYKSYSFRDWLEFQKYHGKI
ncbi:hypothetical protein HK096_008109, partial [Nowakowskiella sp. JEL0078]